jgi:hypothetical protein
MKKLNVVRLGSLVAGVAVALFATFFQLQTVNAPVENQDETEQQSSSEQAVISLSTSSLPAPSQVEADQSYTFLQEIVHDDEEATVQEVPARLVIEKLFETLFEVISAPNAP